METLLEKYRAAQPTLRVGLAGAVSATNLTVRLANLMADRDMSRRGSEPYGVIARLSNIAYGTLSLNAVNVNVAILRRRKGKLAHRDYTQAISDKQLEQSAGVTVAAVTVLLSARNMLNPQLTVAGKIRSAVKMLAAANLICASAVELWPYRREIRQMLRDDVTRVKELLLDKQ